MQPDKWRGCDTVCVGFVRVCDFLLLKGRVFSHFQLLPFSIATLGQSARSLAVGQEANVTDVPSPFKAEERRSKSQLFILSFLR